MTRLKAYSAAKCWPRMRLSASAERDGSSISIACASKMAPYCLPSWSWMARSEARASAAAAMARRSRPISASSWVASTTRWGMRYHSVSSTRAGPMATPADTGIPRLISMPTTLSVGRRRGRAASAPGRVGRWLVVHRRQGQEVAEGREGRGGVAAADLQDQFGARLGGQEQHVEDALAVHAAVAVPDRHLALELPGALGEGRRGAHVQPLRVGDDHDPAQGRAAGALRRRRRDGGVRR